jgi:hypothetical protein
MDYDIVSIVQHARLFRRNSVPAGDHLGRTHRREVPG